MKVRTSFAIRLLIVGVSTLLTLFMLEAIVRIFNLRAHSDLFYQRNAFYGWGYITNKKGWQLTEENEKVSIEINSHGMRDKDYNYAKTSPDIFRILLLGDSFTAAFQVPLGQTYHAILEQHLNEACTSRVEVIDAGVSYYGTDNSLVF